MWHSSSNLTSPAAATAPAGHPVIEIQLLDDELCRYSAKGARKDETGKAEGLGHSIASNARTNDARTRLHAKKQGNDRLVANVAERAAMGTREGSSSETVRLQRLLTPRPLEPCMLVHM